MRYLAIVLLGLMALLSGGCELSSALAASTPPATATTPARPPMATATKAAPRSVAATPMPTPAATVVVDAADRAAMLAAVRRHLRQGGSPLAEGATIRVERLAGDHAYVLVVPRDRDAFEPAGAILRRAGSGWAVVEIGTAFQPESLSRLGVPPGLLEG